MKKPTLKHKLGGDQGFFLKVGCGALLLPHEGPYRTAQCWPDVTCKNCLRRKPKARNP
jgi:hypothetical protein